MKRTLASAALVLAMISPGLILAPPALAHSDLVSSDPADGAVLDAPPTLVSFTFNEDLMPDFVRLIGTDPNGVSGDLPVSSVQGPTVTVDWPAEAPGGTWTVSYRVVSQDGHPIDGGITFTYAAASPSPSSSSAAPTSQAPTSASPTTAEPTSAAPTSAAPSPTTSAAASTGGTSNTGLIAALTVGVIVIIGIVIALVARRRA